MVFDVEAGGFFVDGGDASQTGSSSGLSCSKKVFLAILCADIFDIRS
jgi:hypothetical protein